MTVFTPVDWGRVVEMQTGKLMSKWAEGAKAARDGKPASACPYKPLHYDFVTWMNGWVYAMHQKAKEDDEL